LSFLGKRDFDVDLADLQVILALANFPGH